MQWLQRIEQKFDWLAMPGIIRYLAFLGGLAYALAFISPGFGVHLDFDRDAILHHHQYWRLLTFPFAADGMRTSMVGIIFTACAIQFAITISDSLEHLWGVTRTTLFVLFGWIMLSIGGLIFDLGSFPGLYLFSTIFLAFAAFFPSYRIYIMMIIPAPVWLLAAINLLTLAQVMLTDSSQTPSLLMCHANLLLWVVPVMWRERGHLRRAEQKRRQFQKASKPVHEAFHQCATCGRTEHDDSHIEFRVHRDGKEYCSEHEPK